uniref:Retrotransposon Copia-like N-terminal domain-containing protein n=1 Tax=Cannabis sativa TaxID=3483 RepID=A0A803P455_CANSA
MIMMGQVVLYMACGGEGVVLVPKILKGSENYSTCRRSMSIALVARNKVKFVNGKLPQPDDDHEDYDSWCRCNSTVIYWILHAISDEIVDSIMYHDNAAEVWTELHERFNEKNAPRIFEAKKTMQSLTQGSNMIQGYQEEDRLLEFLVGLNDSYNFVRSQILMRDPLPSVNKAYAAVVQEERKRGLTGGGTCSDVDKAGSSNNGQFAGAVQPFKSKYNCTHCGMNGHSIERCYKLNGYPPGHKYYGRFPNSDAKGTIGKSASGNFSRTNEKPEESPMERDLISSLSSVQCQKLMAILA